MKYDLPFWQLQLRNQSKILLPGLDSIICDSFGELGPDRSSSITLGARMSM